MNPRIKNVIPNKDFTLLLEFTNGEKGIYDVKPLLHLPVFKYLTIGNNFYKATVGNGKTVCWNDDIDISPDTLYLDSIKL